MKLYILIIFVPLFCAVSLPFTLAHLPLGLLALYLSLDFKEELWRSLLKIFYKEISSLNLNTLHKLLTKHKNALVYLGEGYEFTQKHALLLDKRLLKYQKKRKTTLTENFGSEILDDLELFCHHKLFTTPRILTSHMLIMGTTGAGKTRLFDLLISQAIMRGDTVIIFDPKNDADLIKKAELCCNFAQRPQDFLRLDPENPEKSICFNPLACFNNASEIGERITSLMEGSGSAASFKSYANLAITSAVVALINLKRPVTLRNIKEALATPDIYFKALFKALDTITCDLNLPEITRFWENLHKLFKEEKKNSKSAKISELLGLKNFYNYLISHQYLKIRPDLETLFATVALDKDYFAKVSNGAAPILSSLTSESRAFVLSAEPPQQVLDFAQIIKAHKVLHIALPSLKDLQTSQNLGRILLTDLTSQASRIYNHKINADNVPKSPVSIFIDECGEVASPALVQLLNKARGANFAITLAIQSFRDLVKNGGSDQALQILDNCNTKLSLRVGSLETASIFCECLEKTTLASRSQILATSFSEHALTDSQSLIKSYKKDSLISPQILMGLKNLEYFALIGSSTLYKGKIPLVKD